MDTKSLHIAESIRQFIISYTHTRCIAIVFEHGWPGKVPIIYLYATDISIEDIKIKQLECKCALLEYFSYRGIYPRDLYIEVKDMTIPTDYPYCSPFTVFKEEMTNNQTVYTVSSTYGNKRVRADNMNI